MQYLKEKQVYIDRYDLGTIEECSKWYWDIKDKFDKDRHSKIFKKYTDEEFKEEVAKVMGRLMASIKTQRFQHKQETIEKWIETDRLLQEKQDNTRTPTGIKCPECGKEMKLRIKDLHDTYTDNPKMWFMFECRKCNKRRSVNEDGSEWKYDKPKCPKCKSKLITNVKPKKDVSIFTEKCPKCSYKKKDIHDHKKFEQEQDIKEKKARNGWKSTGMSAVLLKKKVKRW
jgi:DNA-directed RNA polymerase subunit M/transcription elongation factor TFIIS